MNTVSSKVSTSFMILISQPSATALIARELQCLLGALGKPGGVEVF